MAKPLPREAEEALRRERQSPPDLEDLIRRRQAMLGNPHSNGSVWDRLSTAGKIAVCVAAFFFLILPPILVAVRLATG